MRLIEAKMHKPRCAVSVLPDSARLPRQTVRLAIVVHLPSVAVRVLRLFRLMQDEKHVRVLLNRTAVSRL